MYAQSDYPGKTTRILPMKRQSGCSGGGIARGSFGASKEELQSSSEITAGQAGPSRSCKGKEGEGVSE